MQLELTKRTYRGDEFKTLVRQYSTERMGYDRPYRNAVIKSVTERRMARMKNKASSAAQGEVKAA